MTNYTTSELLELYLERCGIREYDGGMRRDHAQQQAYYDLRRLVGPDVPMPDVIREMARKFRDDGQAGTQNSEMVDDV